MPASQPAFSVGRRIAAAPVIALVPRCRVDHAGDVSAGTEHEALRPDEQAGRQLGRLSGSDMTLARGQQIGQHVELAQIDAHAAHGELDRNAQAVINALRPNMWQRDTESSQ